MDSRDGGPLRETKDGWRSYVAGHSSSDRSESKPEMYTTNLGELQSILISATRCLDCHDPRCVNVCPEHVDVRGAMSLIVRRETARASAWVQQTDEAIDHAMSAIERSFE